MSKKTTKWEMRPIRVEKEDSQEEAEAKADHLLHVVVVISMTKV